MKKTPNWGIWETMLIVPIVVLNFQSSKPIDAAHARVSALFRLGVSVVCVVGFIAVQVLKRRAKAAEPVINPVAPSLPAGDRAISVTYRGTREDHWRCNLYVLFNRRSTLIVFYVLGFLPAVLIAREVAKSDAALAALGFPILHMLGFAGWMTFILFTLGAGIAQRFPYPGSVRVCTTSLTAEGFQDVTPEKVIPIGWGQVSAIRESRGDIYLWAGQNGCFIPRCAFADPDAAKQFYRAANILWKSRGAVWPDEPADDRSPPPVAPARPSPPPAPVDNPYAAPVSPLVETSGILPANFVTVVLGLIALFLLEYVAVIPFWLMS